MLCFSLKFGIKHGFMIFVYRKDYSLPIYEDYLTIVSSSTHLELCIIKQDMTWQRLPGSYARKHSHIWIFIQNFLIQNPKCRAISIHSFPLFLPSNIFCYVSNFMFYFIITSSSSVDHRLLSILD